MNVQLQDAMERLSGTTDYLHLIQYINNRRNEYLQALSMADSHDMTTIAKLQGHIQGLDEVLRIREDAANAKKTRTS